MYRLDGRNPWYRRAARQERVRRAVGEIETAVEGVRLVLSILQPGQSRTQKTRELVGVRRPGTRIPPGPARRSSRDVML